MFDSLPSGAAGQSGLRGAGAVESLRACLVATLAGVTAGGIPEEALSELVCGLEECRNLLDAAQLAVLDNWDAAAVWAGKGARSGASWMAAETTASRPGAASSIHLARALRSMPHTADALSVGAIGVAQLRLLAGAWRAAPEAFARDEELLVGQARHLRVDELSRVVAFWLAHADPDGAEDRDARRFASRGLSLNQGFDGSWNLTGLLTSDAGEALRSVLDELSKRFHESDKALAAENPEVIPRSAMQRNHDALEQLTRQFRVTSEAGATLSLPSITAVINTERFADPNTLLTEPVGETASGAVVTKAAAERHTCDCSLSRLVMGPDSAPIDLGMSARLPSPAQRRALAVRYRGCAFPGCDCPPGWTNAHHIVHWANGGGTDLANLVPLCVYHHHCVHEGGFGLRRKPSGALEFTTPNGAELRVSKGRAPNPLNNPLDNPPTRP